MKKSLVIILASISSVYGGKFYEEMSKFIEGLDERPQTYRKIEVTNAIDSCCADQCCADSCSDRDLEKLISYKIISNCIKIS